MNTFVMHSLPTKGKKTVTVAATVKDGDMVFAIATVHPNDVFVKKIGRAKAVGRALSNNTRNEHVLVIQGVPSPEEAPKLFLSNAMRLITEAGGVVADRKSKANDQERV